VSIEGLYLAIGYTRKFKIEHSTHKTCAQGSVAECAAELNEKTQKRFPQARLEKETRKAEQSR